jgi:uncharacterized membrane protein YoaK (UPF0700 family)
MARKVMTKKEIEQKRNRWILRVFLTFVLVVGALIAAENIIKLYALSAMYMRIGFLIFGFIYLFQIFSYRRIKCSNCEAPLFNQLSIWLPVPKQCKKCSEIIE